MKVNIEDFTSAVNQISDLATAKMMPGVLLDIKDRSIKVCYTDSNTITLLTEIPAIVTDEDPRGQIAFEYEPLIRIINSCKAPGKLKMDDLSIEFNSDGQCRFRAELFSPTLVKKTDEEKQADALAEAQARAEEAARAKEEAQEQAQEQEIDGQESIGDLPNGPSVIPASSSDFDEDFGGLEDEAGDDQQEQSITEVSNKDYKEVYKKVSDYEQYINWTPVDKLSVKQSGLGRGKYDAICHASADEIANYIAEKEAAGVPPTGIFPPVNENDWENERDTWDIDELQNIMSKFSIESNKIIYIAPNARRAFVSTDLGIFKMPIVSEIKHKILVTSSHAKGLASVLNRLRNKGVEQIYTMPIGDEQRRERDVLYSVDDNSFALSLVNQRQENTQVRNVKTRIDFDYGQYMLEINKDALLMCLSNAKEVSASDSAEFQVVRDESTGDISIQAVVRSTNKSVENKYTVNVYYAIDAVGDISNLKFTVNIKMLHNVISRMTTDDIAFDISVGPDGAYWIRVGEIDDMERLNVKQTYSLNSRSSNEEMAAHREEYLAMCGYFSAAKPE